MIPVLEIRAQKAGAREPDLEELGIDRELSAFRAAVVSDLRHFVVPKARKPLRRTVLTRLDALCER